ncbi:hypothetical protein [Prevotella sp. HUN102]|uniref:hypothetical protein n=1 Tax=Prevotella sp. HUN102 TaxID=1392486 RepID=UPI00048F4450|nr:hypothetical protein [Prevotella sp. HUN102]
MNIIQKPDTFSLLGNLNHFIVSAGREVSFVLKEAGTDTPIVKHIYEPGRDSLVEVNIESFILPLLSVELKDTDNVYPQLNLKKTFKVSFREKDTSEMLEHTFTVLRAGVSNLADSARNFLRANFLTWQPTVKPVTYHTPEFLTYYAEQDSVCRLKTYVGKEGKYQEETITLAVLAGDTAWTIPMQYAHIAARMKKLPSYYDVWIETPEGHRLTYVQRYVATDIRSEQEQWIVFENSLGGIDTFRAYGDLESTAKHTHNTALIEGTAEEYRVDTEREYRKNTGLLDDRERRWLLDFFPSLGKYVCEDGALRRIILVESDVSFQARELPSSYTFTYKYATACPYLNLKRTDIDCSQLRIEVPDSATFTVAPRLVEFDRIQLSEGALFPVQSPYSDRWQTTTMGAVLAFISEQITAAYKDDGGIGHRHHNLKLLERISAAGRYILLNSEKISAGYADLAEAAEKLSEKSTEWRKILRKDVPDTAHGKITFEEGISTDSIKDESFVPGIQGKGLGIWIDEHGRSHVETDILLARVKQVAASLELHELSYVGGNFVLSPAGGQVAEVVPVDSGGRPVGNDVKPYSYRCYLTADDGTRRTGTRFRPGDQARCQTFNLEGRKNAFGIYENVENRYYWRLVTGAGSEIIDGKKKDYADLSAELFVQLEYRGVKFDCIGYDNSVENDIPAPGDKIVQEGSQTDPDRRSIIALMTSDTPGIYFYDGISDYDLASHIVHELSTRRVELNSERFALKTYSGAITPMVAYLGDWQPDGRYGHYDSVTHDGSTWLCTVPKGQFATEEPSESSSQWKRQVARGESPVSVQISGGNIIRNGQGSTTLTAYVWKGNEDITERFKPGDFSWTRDSGNPEYDTEWNRRHRGFGRTLTVSAQDVFKRATFDCILTM